MASPLSPVIRVARRRLLRGVPRLPAAENDHGTTEGTGPVLRLAVLGDSAAAGVGAPTHEHALAGTLAASLTGLTGRTVSWRAIAEPGATTERVGQVLIRDLNIPADGWRPDVVVLVVGLNDLLRGRPLAGWERDLDRLLTELRHRAPRAHVVVSGLPPLDRFPLLPGPLRLIAGHRLRRMGRVLAKTSGRAGHHYVPLAVTDAGRELFAADSFHPSPAGYRTWARMLAPAIAGLLGGGAALPRSATVPGSR